MSHYSIFKPTLHLVISNLFLSTVLFSFSSLPLSACDPPSHPKTSSVPNNTTISSLTQHQNPVKLQSPFVTILNTKADDLARALPLSFHYKTLIVNHSHKIQSSDLKSHLQREFQSSDGNTSQQALHISAPADTPFKFIRKIITTATNLNVFSIYLTVKQPISTHSKNNAPSPPLHIRLPSIPHSDVNMPPIYVKASKSGAIFINTGSDQKLLDHDPRSRQLPQLSSALKKARQLSNDAGYQLVIAFWADPEVSYQSVIDVLTTFKLTNVHSIDMINLPSIQSQNSWSCTLSTPRNPAPHSLPVAPQWKPPIENPHFSK